MIVKFFLLATVIWYQHCNARWLATKVYDKGIRVQTYIAGGKRQGRMPCTFITGLNSLTHVKYVPTEIATRETFNGKHRERNSFRNMGMWHKAYTYGIWHYRPRFALQKNRLIPILRRQNTRISYVSELMPNRNPCSPRWCAALTVDWVNTYLIWSWNYPAEQKAAAEMCTQWTKRRGNNVSGYGEAGKMAGSWRRAETKRELETCPNELKSSWNVQTEIWGSRAGRRMWHLKGG